jgi:hypothetical protein
MEILGMGCQPKDSSILRPPKQSSDLSRVCLMLCINLITCRYANDEMIIDSSHSKNLSEIMRDVGRTFPTHPFFVSAYGPGEAILARILKASLRFRPDVGYCQASETTRRSSLNMTWTCRE